MTVTGLIPALVNSASGTADAARSALEGAEGFELQEVEPAALAATVRDAVKRGVPRLLVAGGDGTIGTAAAELLGTNVELAILPGGTLNHFATDLGISTDPKESLACAASGAARAVDVGTVNGHVFLNTSSVGAYVHFVKVREYLERRFGYRLASAIAAIRALFQLRTLAVAIEVDGQRRVFRTPIVFIGVGERELKLPTLGNRVADGKRGLHVMIVTGRSRGRVLAIALNAVARGIKTAAKTPELESFIVDRCSISLSTSTTVALDGELVRLDSPLEYVLSRDALRVVCP